MTRRSQVVDVLLYMPQPVRSCDPNVNTLGMCPIEHGSAGVCIPKMLRDACRSSSKGESCDSLTFLKDILHHMILYTI